MENTLHLLYKNWSVNVANVNNISSLRDSLKTYTGIVWPNSELKIVQQAVNIGPSVL